MTLFLIVDTFEDKIVKSYLNEMHVWEFLVTQTRTQLYDERYKVVSLKVKNFEKDRA